MFDYEVTHLWANQSRKEGRNGHCHFSGDTIYSYSLAIGRHYKGVALIIAPMADGTWGNSNTTAIHCGGVRSASEHLTQFFVDAPENNPSKADIKAYGLMIAKLTARAAKARLPQPHLEALQAKVNEANLFCKTFGFKTRFGMPGNLAELKVRAKEASDRNRVNALQREAKRVAEFAELAAKWIAGEDVFLPHDYSKVHLRQREDRMETTKRASVPIVAAKRAWRFVCEHRAAGWKRNGETFQVGDFHLDAVNEHGVVAGCHRIEWAEIERFAAVMGWKEAA